MKPQTLNCPSCHAALNLTEIGPVIRCQHCKTHIMLTLPEILYEKQKLEKKLNQIQSQIQFIRQLQHNVRRNRRENLGLMALEMGISQQDLRNLTSRLPALVTGIAILILSLIVFAVWGNMNALALVIPMVVAGSGVTVYGAYNERRHQRYWNVMNQFSKQIRVNHLSLNALLKEAREVQSRIASL